jgi:hypothetical protein
MTAEARWEQLVHSYEKAQAASDVAFETYDRLPLQDAGNSQQERNYEAKRDELYRLEDRLLAMTPPTLAAAAYQLKLLGMRHHSVDLDEPPLPNEQELEGAAVRRIYEAMRDSIRRI